MAKMTIRNASKFLIGAGLFDIVFGLLVVLFGAHYLGIDVLVTRLFGGAVIVVGIAVILLGVYVGNRTESGSVGNSRRSGRIIKR